MGYRTIMAVAAFATLASFVGPSHAASEVRQASYTASGTVVVKNAGEPAAVDDGVLTCNGVTGVGIGGGCVSFSPQPDPAVGVTDDVSGTQVAFQVCLDNNGDSACVSPDFGPCADEIFFSHDDGGRFFNPLGPLPPNFKAGCPGGPWPGYVVFLCTAVHVAANGSTAGSPHTHPATEGTIVTTTTGTGFGNFCGGSPQNASNKRYLVS